jgi:aspartate racemase
MKLIGLIGGMSWESTAATYRLLNEEVRRRLGGLHSARVLLVSLDFEPIEKLQTAGRWDEASEVLIEAGQRLERGGAAFALLCTNTMHKLLPRMREVLSLPFLHIADATAGAIQRSGQTTVGLLGTRFTMEQEFYRSSLEGHGLRVIVPAAAGRSLVDRVIYDELCRGEIRADSLAAVLEVIDQLEEAGAEGVVLGCTELPLLVRPEHTALPLYDTTAIHARAAVDAALA